MLHEKFIEISSANNLSYRRPFNNRFSISRKGSESWLCNSKLTKARLLKDGACLASSHALFTLTMAALIVQAVIAHQSPRFWHRREKCEGGWAAIISNYYLLKSHNNWDLLNRPAMLPNWSMCTGNHQPVKAPHKRMASGMHERTMKPLNLSPQRSTRRVFELWRHWRRGPGRCSNSSEWQSRSLIASSSFQLLTTGRRMISASD